MAGNNQPLARIASVQEKYSVMLMNKPHVVGISIGPVKDNGVATGEYALIVLVDEDVSSDQLDAQDRIPAELDGVPVIVREVGMLKAFT